jgi:hypothetical protein
VDGNTSGCFSIPLMQSKYRAKLRSPPVIRPATVFVRSLDVVTKLGVKSADLYLVRTIQSTVCDHVTIGPVTSWQHCQKYITATLSFKIDTCLWHNEQTYLDKCFDDDSGLLYSDLRPFQWTAPVDAASTFDSSLEFGWYRDGCEYLLELLYRHNHQYHLYCRTSQ